MNPRNRIESLAPECLLMILTHLPDLASLDSLLRASPVVYRLFNVRGPEIFEAVWSSGVTHEYTCALIRIIVLFRSEALLPHVHTLDDLREFIRHDTTCHRYDPPEWEHLPLTLSPDTSAIVLRGIIATNRRIIRLTVGCLVYYLDRFNSLRPTHLVDKDFKFVSKYQGSERLFVPACQLKPTETPYPVRDVGPPLWIEEQRILRSFWRIQLFHEVENAVKDFVIDWPFNGISIMDLYNVPIGGLSGDNEFDENSYGEPYLYQQGTLLEHKLIESVLHYVEENKELFGDSVRQGVGRDWPICKPIGENDCEILNYYSSATYSFFFTVGRRTCSPLQHVTFKPFRNLGFAIWSTERMSAYGFLDSHGMNLRDHSYFLAWKSVLGQGEIQKVEQVNRAWYERIINKPRPKNGQEAT